MLWGAPGVLFHHESWKLSYVLSCWVHCWIQKSEVFVKVVFCLIRQTSSTMKAGHRLVSVSGVTLKTQKTKFNCSLILLHSNTYSFSCFRLIWTLYFLFTSLHLYANYSAVRGVVMETINQARLYILLAEYFMSGTILSPVAVNKREPVLWSMYWVSYEFALKLSKSFRLNSRVVRVLAYGLERHISGTS